jgi:nucleoside-diphosphate-sugar epimerase
VWPDAVRGLDTRLVSEAPYEQVEVDVRSLGAAVAGVRGADVVVHLGAIPRPTGRTPEEVFASNTLGTFNVVEACSLLGVRRLVYASSLSVVGLPFNTRPVRVEYLPIDERHPCRPQDAYGLSKLVGEQIVEAAVLRGDVDATSIRMSWIQTADSFRRDISPRRDDVDLVTRSLWSYVDARDAAAAHVRAVESSEPGHLRLLVSAPDTFMEEPTEELVVAAFGREVLTRLLTGNEGVIDCSLAVEKIGHVSVHSWREYPA